MSCDSDKRKCKLGCLPGYRLQSSSRRLTSSAWNRAEGREEERGGRGGGDGCRPRRWESQGADLGLRRRRGSARKEGDPEGPEGDVQTSVETKRF